MGTVVTNLIKIESDNTKEIIDFLVINGNFTPVRLVNELLNLDLPEDTTNFYGVKESSEIIDCFKFYTETTEVKDNSIKFESRYSECVLLLDNLSKKFKDATFHYDWNYDDHGGPYNWVPAVKVKNGEVEDCEDNFLDEEEE